MDGTRLTIHDCQLILTADHGSSGAVYYASGHPGGYQSLLSNISIVAGSASASAGSPAIRVMAKIKWSCQPGYWAPPAGEPFGVGDVQDCKDADDRQTCSAGFFGAAADYVTPTCNSSCSLGHYCPVAATEPLRCPPGTSMPTKGANSESSCIRCGAGQYNEQAGATACNSCAAGRFNEEAAQTTCTSCPVMRVGFEPMWSCPCKPEPSPQSAPC